MSDNPNESVTYFAVVDEAGNIVQRVKVTVTTTIAEVEVNGAGDEATATEAPPVAWDRAEEATERTNYHVRYVLHDSAKVKGPVKREPETIVLFGLHPLVWASWSKERSRGYVWTEILDWREFEDPEGKIKRSMMEANCLNWEEG